MQKKLNDAGVLGYGTV